tara:strand:+ start:2458 stop:5226 length:2769 start_codon:yes stop_codon:yes gene_type:complete
MSLDMLRTIKIRSVENAEYTKNYNRLRFLISPDNMSTDLSESYIAFKLFVVNGATGVAYTAEELASLDASSIMFSFGDSVGDAYSPACLIKVARLFAQGNQTQILEEIQFSNVLSQTLYQLKSDFETLASESLLTMGSTGMLLNGSLSASTSSYFGASVDLQDQSVQVNVKLSDLFGCCRSTNFWLSITEGLMVELELEDVKPLITQSCVVDLSNALPNTVVFDPAAPTVLSTGFTDSPSTNHFSTRCPSQNLYAPSSNAMASLLTGTTGLISTPQSYRFDSSYLDSFFPPNGGDVDTNALVATKYYRIVTVQTAAHPDLAEWQTAGWTGTALPNVGDVFLCTQDTVAGGVCIEVTKDNKIVGKPGSTADIITINPSIKWSVANMALLKIVQNAVIKLVFKISQVGHRDRIFEYISTIYGVPVAWASDAVGAQIMISDIIAYPIYDGTYLQNALVTLDSFEIIPNSIQVPFQQPAFNTLVSNNLIQEVSVATVQFLQKAGCLSGGTLAQVTAGTISQLTGSNVFFNADLSIDNEVLGTGVEGNVVSIYPDEFDTPDVPSLRKLYSNQTKKMPIQTGQVRIVKATKNANNTTWDVTFQTMGLENNNSLQGMCMVAPNADTDITAGLGIRTACTGCTLTIHNVKIPASVNASTMVVGEYYFIVATGGIADAVWQACGNDGVATNGQTFQCIAPMPTPYANGFVSWVPPNRSASTYVAKSWKITKSELVLVQREKDPQIQPSTIYPTWKVEAVTIENQLLTEYMRQFIVVEPNCFNAVLCTPNFNADSADLFPQSLISKSRNINQYRWSLNNIDNTNRNISVKNNISSYPSTLHLDKLLDCMRNDVNICRSLSGINGVARSVDAPVVFPLKIYTASDAESHYLNPMSGYTLQWAAYSDSLHNMYITPGPIFLFKQCFRTLPPVGM